MRDAAYEISEGTYAICPNEKSGSIILEDDGVYEIQESPSSVIDYGCHFFGSTYQGRREGAINILNTRYKVPIVVEDSQNIIFFPTANKDEKDCCWIAINKIRNFHPVGKRTKVEFIDGKTFTFDISFHSFQNQVLRASRLDSILRSRKGL